MKYTTLAIFFFMQFAGAQKHVTADKIYIKLPSHFDTVNVYKRFPQIMAIIMDRHSQKTYTSPEGTTFDAQRTPSFSHPLSKIPPEIRRKTIDLAGLSDSLSLSPHSFLTSHTFFLILIKNDTAYFYKAKGDYMYKDYKNDVSY